MKKTLFFFVALSLIATGAMAHDVTGRLGLGFTDSDAPVGGRYWFSEKLGVDAGIGFVSTDIGSESLTTFSVAVAVPIVISEVSDRVNFLFHPAFRFSSQGQPEGSTFDSATSMTLIGALEFEVFVTNDFSVSAAHGLAVNIFDNGDPDPNAESLTNFGTFGSNMTELGFHYYLMSN